MLSGGRDPWYGGKLFAKSRQTLREPIAIFVGTLAAPKPDLTSGKSEANEAARRGLLLDFDAAG